MENSCPTCGALPEASCRENNVLVDFHIARMVQNMDDEHWDAVRGEATSDAVEHPSHYTKGKYETIDVIEDMGFDKCFYRANAIKYIARSPHKNSEVEDLRKGVWYLQRLIAKLERG